VVDGRHLRQALDRLVVATVEQQARVVQEMVVSLEDAHRVNFIQRSIHDATLTGKPSEFHKLLTVSRGCCSQRKNSFTSRIRPMTPRTGTRIDPDTLEPMSDKEVTIMVEDGVGMSMCMEVLGVTAKNYKAVVLVTADGDLSQAMEQMCSAGVKVTVCCLRQCLPSSLAKFVREPVSLIGGGKWLESHIMSGLDRVVAKVDSEKGLLRTSCKAGRCCQIHDESHEVDYLHPCPDWSMCDQVPKPIEVSPTSGRYWLPKDRLDLDHIQRFQHPCPLTNCRIKGPEHYLAWDHSQHGGEVSISSSGNFQEAAECNHHRRVPHKVIPHGSTTCDDILKPGSPQESDWHFSSFDHSASYNDNNAFEKRSRPSLGFKANDFDFDDIDVDADEQESDEDMKEFMRILRYTFQRSGSFANRSSRKEEEEELIFDDPGCDPVMGNDHLALFPMSM